MQRRKCSLELDVKPRAKTTVKKTKEGNYEYTADNLNSREDFIEAFGDIVLEIGRMNGASPEEVVLALMRMHTASHGMQSLDELLEESE